jgi:glycosylphosphatidylinositol transamidase (GPIT) subunit GPI8
MSDEELRAKVQRMNLESSYKKMMKERTPPSQLEKTKKVVDETTALVNKANTMNREALKNKKKTLDLSEMTDQQLRDRINRTNLERQYNDLFGTVTVSKGRARVTRILETSGTVLAVGSSALGIALAIKELKKKV